MRRAAVAAVAVGALALVGGAALTAAAAFTCPTGARCFAAGYTHPIYVGSKQVYAPSSSVTPSTTPSTTTTTPASTTTTAPSSTTTTTAPTTSSTAPPPPTTAPNTTTATTPGQFSESFTGNVGLDRFDRSVYYRNIVEGYPAGHDSATEWMADHDAMCGGPDTHRIVTGDPAKAADLFFMCRDHLMTAMPDVDGYSIAMFKPKQTFTDVKQVCWDVNLTDEGTREWFDVSIVPAAAGNFYAPSWLAGPGQAGGVGTVSYLKSGGVHFAWGPFSHHLQIASAQGEHDDTFHEYPNSSTPSSVRFDLATRSTNCAINNGNGTATFTQVQGSATYRYTAAVTWPSGSVKVVFAQHQYTATKDGPIVSFTEHWDNIQVT